MPSLARGVAPQAVEFFSTFGTIKDSEYTGTTSNGGATRTGGVWDPTLSVLDTSYGDQTIVYANLGTGQPSSNYISNMTIRTPAPTCAYLNAVGGLVPSATSRNICHGSEYWGTFTRAWFSLFQVPYMHMHMHICMCMCIHMVLTLPGADVAGSWSRGALARHALGRHALGRPRQSVTSHMA